MYEEPPALPFPSLQDLKGVATEILKAQKNPTTPDVEFRFFEPEQSALQTQKKRQRPTNKACEVCKKKKVRCDINAPPQEQCPRTNCQCRHHETVAKEDQPSTPAALSIIIQPQQSNESIPSSTVIRKPGLLKSGHYNGETSFCGYLAAADQPPAIFDEDEFPTFTPVPAKPYIHQEDQLYLVDVYCASVNSFFPLISKDQLLAQLDCISQKKHSYLSPLFFYALFARAAIHVEKGRTYSVTNKSFLDLGTECMNYASALVNCYRDKPRVSTILALVIMANHLDQEKKYENLTKSWLWAGEAFRMALDMGLHRSVISVDSNAPGQLCIRTFWLAYIADCTISMTYGRPSSTEEKVLDVALPIRLQEDDDATAVWVDGLNSLVALSKVTARVIKFNYCPPPPFIIQGPVKRHNAFLVSVDSWLIDIVHPVKEPESPISNAPNLLVEESAISKRMNFQKHLFFYINLILLHRPYVNDVLTVRNTNNRPSYDICSYAAVVITDTASKLETEELMYHAKSPMVAYALVMASRVHIMNAASANPEKYNSSKNFSLSLNTLSKLPQAQNPTSMLCDVILDLELQYNNRFSLAQEQEQQQSVQTTQPIVTAAQAVFSPSAIEESTHSKTSSTIDSSSQSKIIIRDYKHPKDPVGRKKPKLKASSSNSNRQEQKQKQRQKQQRLQSVFSTQMTDLQVKQQPTLDQAQKIEHQATNATQVNPSSTSSNTFTPPPPPAPIAQQHIFNSQPSQPLQFSSISQQSFVPQYTFNTSSSNSSSSNSSSNIPPQQGDINTDNSNLDFIMQQLQQDSSFYISNITEPHTHTSFMEPAATNYPLVSNQYTMDYSMMWNQEELLGQRLDFRPSEETLGVYTVNRAQDSTTGVSITRENDAVSSSHIFHSVYSNNM